ncbi:hypothetical protein [uncultured Pseudokineococcus sp.]|uniref:hypothetical protein n=1 Tax=uncultured Pseudokineococcus sp. TaxID=1642928 RepID=UPI00261965CB|nr:hypothetical protein [uncultured Pseudokineococcus sp.]
MSPAASRAADGARTTRGLACALALAAAAALVACSPAPTAGAGAPSSTAVASSGAPPAPALEVPPVEAPPVPAPWEPGPGEVQPEVKTAAARAVEVAGTWDEAATAAAGGSPSGGDGESLLERLDAAGLLAPDVDRAALAAALGPLASPASAAAAAEVLYPQYGGLTARAASVMVAARQELRGPRGAASSRGTTLDVRLAPSPDGDWRVTGVVPAAPRPPDGAPSALGEQVLASPRVELPEDAAADVRQGVVADDALAVLLRLAEQHEVAVSVFRTGHPAEVFGTDRLSNHTRGRAVDVWRLDGRLVVDPAARGVAVAAMRAAGAAGATEVGGPVDLDAGPGGGFFSDALHADHLHIGLTPGEEPIGPPR